jgi:hypothetical protein
LSKIIIVRSAWLSERAKLKRLKHTLASRTQLVDKVIVPMATDQSDSLFLRRERNPSATRGQYGLVAMTPTVDEDSNVDECDEPTKVQALELEQGLSSPLSVSSSATICIRWQRILFLPLLPDDRLDCCGWLILDGVEAVRMIKFFVITWMGLLLMYFFVRFMVRSCGPPGLPRLYGTTTRSFPCRRHVHSATVCLLLICLFCESE